ncbi:acyl-CoA N-acyltransferase [Mycena galopus ATCC 62051]|nr:acyl-CoA N-acyltransferase [Mycena galopus ATCC 62051]
MEIEKAQASDVPAIRAMVIAAYSKYIERIGKPPAPMTADYDALVRDETHDVRVLRISDEVLGCIILGLDADDKDALKIHNLVVAPSAQGHGYGRVLMGHAEEVARQRGRTALTLFTNVRMWENLAMYAKMGFVETERRVEDGFERVYFRADLARDD